MFAMPQVVYSTSRYVAGPSVPRARQPEGAERPEAREVVADDEQRARQLPRVQDPPHLLQRLLPQQVSLHVHTTDDDASNAQPWMNSSVPWRH
jgi:hypothetical protein